MRLRLIVSRLPRLVCDETGLVARLLESHVHDVFGPAARTAAQRRLAGCSSIPTTSIVASAFTCRRSRRGGLSSWNIACATSTAITDGFWLRGFREYGRGRQLHGLYRLRHRYHGTENAPKIGFGRVQAALETSRQEIQYLAGRLIGAKEDERARIARDLHDDVSQQIAGVSIAVSGLKQRLGEDAVSEDLRQEFLELQRQTLKLAHSVRQISHDLHPTVLQHLGLVKGLTWSCGELARAHAIAVSCSAEGGIFESLTPDAALCIYRIAQEALRNIHLHTPAPAVRM